MARPEQSLTLRLVLTSGFWIACALIGASLLLINLFTGHIERRFDEQLLTNLRGLIASVDVDDSARLSVRGNPLGPSFSQPLSGWYWQVSQGAEMIQQSASSDLSRVVPLVVAPDDDSTVESWHEIDGPKDEPLRAVLRTIRLPNTGRGLDFLVAGPRKNIINDVRRFTRQLLTTMGVLALGLIAAMMFQVRFALRPLRRLRRNVAQVRSGERPRISDLYPTEMKPVVSELNELLDHNESIIEQARVQGANLAHAIKNPLTVIQNEANRMDEDQGKVLRNQVSQLSQSVERHLTRFRSAGAGHSANARTDVSAVVDDLIFSMEMIHQDRAIDFGRTNLDGLYFRGERADLEEMLGNLLDNACKWAKSSIHIRGERHDDVIRIHIEDDGSGIPEDSRKEVLKPGKRLDESVKGTGLGLAIVQDVADLYRGAIDLGARDAGGTRATLELPRAA